LLALVILLFGMQAYDVSFFPRGAIDPAQVGTLGDWFVGFATVGAVVIAVAQLRSDRARAEDERRRREVALASEVYSWVESRRLHPGRMSQVLVLVNRTPSPVYDWSASLDGASQVIANGESSGPILPGERLIELDEERFPVVPHGPTLKTTIDFVTSLGAKFTRDSNGNLAEAK
jgi:hypothetical protein